MKRGSGWGFSEYVAPWIGPGARLAIWKRLPALPALMLLAGCVLSIEPFYTPDAVMDPPPLHGKWHLLDKHGEPGRGEVWEFDGKVVRAFDEDGTWRAFDITWIKVAGVTLADTYPRDSGDDLPMGEGYYRIHKVAFHMLSRVEITDQRITFQPLDNKTFNQLTRDAPVGTWTQTQEYETRVFNASPADWAAFLSRHAGDRELFSSKSQLVFVPDDG